MENISELVWLYVKRRPFIKENLREGIVNYSALARKIALEAFASKKHTNAIKMALIRLTEKINEKEEDLEGKILEVLGQSSLTLRSKVAVVITSREIEELKYLSYAEGRGIITYIINESEIKNVKKNKSIILLEENMNLVSIHSPPTMEEVPGVISHILNALASEGINIVEFVSCYTDTLLVIKQSDTKRAYEVLNALMS